MDAIRELRAHCAGITVNDVFVAVAGGAVRRYLLSKNELMLSAGLEPIKDPAFDNSLL